MPRSSRTAAGARRGVRGGASADDERLEQPVGCAQRHGHGVVAQGEVRTGAWADLEVARGRHRAAGAAAAVAAEVAAAYVGEEPARAPRRGTTLAPLREGVHGRPEPERL